MKVAKAAGGELDDLGLRHLRHFVGGGDDGVGDQMRQMAGDREHEIMMIRAHHLDLGANRGPERAQAIGGSRVDAFRRRQMHQRLMKSSAKPGIRPRMFGARDRMGRHEMNALRQMRRHVPDDRALDRADVGDDRTRFEMIKRSPAPPARRHRRECRG